MVAGVFFHKDFIGIDGTVHTPEWSFRGAVILPGGVKRVCSSVKSGVLLRNSPNALSQTAMGLVVGRTLGTNFLIADASGG